MANQKLGVVRRCDCEVCRDHPRSSEAREHTRINRLMSTLDEKNRRRVAAVLAEQRGHGGLALLSRITGMSVNTIKRGAEELGQDDDLPADRARAEGGGRKPLEKKLQS